MKTSFKQKRNLRGDGPASRTSTKRKAGSDSNQTTGKQGRLMRDIENSAAMILQRQQQERSFNQPLQRQPEEEEELQMQQAPIQQQSGLEEEELMQGKFGTVQRLPEDEDELQMQQSPMQQKPELDEEELMQGKFASLQRQPEEEELMQGKFDALQCQSLEEEEEPLQGKSEPALQREQQADSRSNQTGMPDSLKAGIEALSGQDLSAVRVHYNSSRPKEVNALAFAQGNAIHLGSGQERHLPHEAWHTVQQREGRVEPTLEMGGEKINDDSALEREADVMGARARQYRKR